MKGEYVVGKVSDLPAGTHKVVEAGGRQVGVFNVKGSFYALPNACFHQNGPLCRGKVDGTWIAPKERNYEYEWVYEGEIVICPWHSLEFHIPTGRCLAFPDRKLPVYEVKVEGDDLKVVL
jgi:nitrite reductase/ring-hydroxylating ferredoxin subunit